MEKVLIIEPVFKETIWGGTKLKKEFSYETPSNHTGECWGISGHPNGDCRIKNMPGYTISSLWRDYHDILSDNPSPVFPILIKLIDANSDLSIQVHPDDAYAKIHENSLGKHECWYILPSDPDAKLVIGHKAQTKEELVSMIEHHQFDDLLNVVDVRSGDFFDIPPGTVHAIKAGCLLYESQQSSDITYRLYDYNRVGNDGKKRPLKLDKALQVMDGVEGGVLEQAITYLNMADTNVVSGNLSFTNTLS
ncbi:MAG: type I phosphomannose isomerase catalytic subunit [bacterium]